MKLNHFAVYQKLTQHCKKRKRKSHHKINLTDANRCTPGTAGMALCPLLPARLPEAWAKYCFDRVTVRIRASYSIPGDRARPQGNQARIIFPMILFRRNTGEIKGDSKRRSFCLSDPGPGHKHFPSSLWRPGSQRAQRWGRESLPTAPGGTSSAGLPLSNPTGPSGFFPPSPSPTLPEHL